MTTGFHYINYKSYLSEPLSVVGIVEVQSGLTTKESATPTHKNLLANSLREIEILVTHVMQHLFENPVGGLLDRWAKHCHKDCFPQPLKYTSKLDPH